MGDSRYAWQLAARANPAHSRVHDKFRASRQARRAGVELTRKALGSTRTVSPTHFDRKPGMRTADDGFETMRINERTEPRRVKFSSLSERRRRDDLASASSLAPATYNDPPLRTPKSRVAFASTTDRSDRLSKARAGTARSMYRPFQSPLDLDKLPTVEALIRAVDAKQPSASASGRRSPSSRFSGVSPSSPGRGASRSNSASPMPWALADHPTQLTGRAFQQKIRVTVRRPGQYCTYNTYRKKTQRDEKKVGHYTTEAGFFPHTAGASITASGPYVSAADQRRLDHLASKKRWIAGDMQVNDHKATVSRRDMLGRSNPVRLSGPATDKPHTDSGRRIDKEVFRTQTKHKWMNPKRNFERF